jgi:hypothetical protein
VHGVPTNAGYRIIEAADNRGNGALDRVSVEKLKTHSTNYGILVRHSPNERIHFFIGENNASIGPCTNTPIRKSFACIKTF